MISKGIACVGIFRFVVGNSSVQLEDNRASISIVESVNDLITASLTADDKSFADSWITCEKLMLYFAPELYKMS